MAVHTATKVKHASSSVSSIDNLDEVDITDDVAQEAKGGENNSCMPIDNSRNTYSPVRLRCGVELMCRPEVLDSCPEILEHLNTDLSQCLEILPISVRALVRRTRVWVNRSYCYGRCDRPEQINHTTAHHHEAWLLW
jgi:hypothetical protein